MSQVCTEVTPVSAACFMATRMRRIVSSSDLLRKSANTAKTMAKNAQNWNCVKSSGLSGSKENTVFRYSHSIVRFSLISIGFQVICNQGVIEHVAYEAVAFGGEVYAVGAHQPFSFP